MKVIDVHNTNFVDSRSMTLRAPGSHLPCSNPLEPGLWDTEKISRLLFVNVLLLSCERRQYTR